MVGGLYNLPNECLIVSIPRLDNSSFDVRIDLVNTNGTPLCSIVLLLIVFLLSDTLFC